MASIGGKDYSVGRGRHLWVLVVGIGEQYCGVVGVVGERKKEGEINTTDN